MTTETTTARDERIANWRQWTSDHPMTDRGATATIEALGICERNAFEALVDGDSSEAILWGLLAAVRAARRI